MIERQERIAYCRTGAAFTARGLTDDDLDAFDKFKANAVEAGLDGEQLIALLRQADPEGIRALLRSMATPETKS